MGYNGAYSRLKEMPDTRPKGLELNVESKIDNAVYHGDALMSIGLPVPYASADFVSCQWNLNKVVS